MPDIVIKGLSKRFSDKTVLDHLSLTIPDGSVFLLMGPSGCGKTTLLRILAGLETADEGTVTGIDPQSISFMFQENRLIDHLSALSNCILPLSGKGAKQLGLQALAELGLAGEEHKPARKLSGGMARRVAIARAMLFPASVVFMDEPFKGLDAENLAKAVDFVKKHAAGKTLVIVTHSMDECRLMGGRVFTLSESQNFSKETV